jgi:hypothetical protein
LGRGPKAPQDDSHEGELSRLIKKGFCSLCSAVLLLWISSLQGKKASRLGR